MLCQRMRCAGLFSPHFEQSNNFMKLYVRENFLVILHDNWHGLSASKIPVIIHEMYIYITIKDTQVHFFHDHLVLMFCRLRIFTSILTHCETFPHSSVLHWWRSHRKLHFVSRSYRPQCPQMNKFKWDTERLASAIGQCQCCNCEKIST